MEPQLHLIDSGEGDDGARRPRRWKLSRHTVETGRAGIELARAALDDARRRHPANPRQERPTAA